MLIVGGTDASLAELGYTTLDSSEGMCFWNPPDIPVALQDFTLVAVAAKVYLCGGLLPNYTASVACFTLDTQNDNSSWKHGPPFLNTERVLSGEAIGSHIWFISFHSILHDYDIMTQTITNYSLPFLTAPGHCSAANSTHSYLVGVGFKYTEVWVNTEDSSPTSWTMVAMLPISMTYSSCLLFENSLYILGGHDFFVPNKAAFVIDITTYTMRRIADMNTARIGSETMVLDNKPAVVGGMTSYLVNVSDVETTAFSSIEIYDEDLNSWEEIDLVMEIERAYFGLVQLP